VPLGRPAYRIRAGGQKVDIATAFYTVRAGLSMLYRCGDAQDWRFSATDCRESDSGSTLVRFIWRLPTARSGVKPDCGGINQKLLGISGLRSL
jgi:hypothetical protein